MPRHSSPSAPPLLPSSPPPSTASSRVARARFCALVALLLAGAPAAAAPVLTADEEQQVAEGEIVLRKRTSAHANGVRVEAIVDARASKEALWAALTDLRARLASSDTLEGMEFYKPATASEQWVKWSASRFGIDIVYHNRYVASADRSTYTHELDRSMPNDLAASRGVYTLMASPRVGCTRLVYDVDTDFGRSLPGFVRDWLTQSGTRSYLEDIVRRAEAR
jgi:hypothetical protein